MFSEQVVVLCSHLLTIHDVTNITDIMVTVKLIFRISALMCVSVMIPQTLSVGVISLLRVGSLDGNVLFVLTAAVRNLFSVCKVGVRTVTQIFIHISLNKETLCL